MPVVVDEFMVSEPEAPEDRLAFLPRPEYGNVSIWDAELNGTYKSEDAPYYAARAEHEDQEILGTLGALSSEAVLPSKKVTSAR